VASATIEHLCYWYPSWEGSAPAALFDVNLELTPGLTMLGGDSGAGKSTLLRLLNGLVPHFHGGRIAGRAEVGGLDVLTTPTRDLARHVGFVFQESQVGFVRGIVAREIAAGPENLGFGPREVEAMVGAVMERVGIGGMGGRRLSTLSGGERQRVALAGALAAAPEVVALDEPTSQLDEAGVSALGAILDELAGSGHTVVVAEQRTGRLRGSGSFRLVMVEGGQLSSEVSSGPAGPAEAGRRAGPAEAGRRAGPAVAGRAAEPPGMTVWALRGVSAGIGGRMVVEDVDLSGCEGEILVLTGPNGAGKTTLLRTIAGLLPPLAGRVERAAGRSGVAGRTSRIPCGSRIAYLPQDPGTLLHRRSVLDEVAQTLRWSGVSDDPMRILDQLGLGSLAGRDPRDLSGGQRQRAALATVLVGRPELALLDEPTRGMDGASRLALSKTLRDLADEGASVVLATHDSELAAQLGDRVVVVHDGRLTAPTGTAPTGTAAIGTAAIGTAPTGTAPTGTAAIGTAATGTAPTGTAPTGTAVPR
jgi:energy-coupling factor transporter ATP-binding protein EcfA2